MQPRLTRSMARPIAPSCRLAPVGSSSTSSCPMGVTRWLIQTTRATPLCIPANLLWQGPCVWSIFGSYLDSPLNRDQLSSRLFTKIWSPLLLGNCLVLTIHSISPFKAHKVNVSMSQIRSSLRYSDIHTSETHHLNLNQYQLILY